MTKKILVIEACRQCRYFGDSIYNYIPSHCLFDTYIKKPRKITKKYAIPTWCPLEGVKNEKSKSK